MISSNSTRTAGSTSDLTARTWLRTPFGARGDRSRPTRPTVDHGHEVARYQPSPLV
jgi:hypothetical protein